MTKKLSYQDEEDGEIFEGESENVTELMDDIDSQLKNLLSEIGDDKNDVEYKVKVYRILPKKGERSILFECGPEENIVERVMNHYGTGKYEARIMRSVNSGGFSLYRKKQFNTEAPSVNSLASVKDDMSSIIRAMAEQQERQFQQLKEIMAPKRQELPPVDPMAQMRQMVEMFSMMKTIQGEPPKQNGDNTEIFMRGIEFAKSIAVESGGDVSTGQMVLEAIKNLGKPLAEMMVRNQAPALAPPQPQRPSALRPVGTGHNTPVLSNPAPKPSEREGADVNIIANIIQNRLGKELPKLCEKAAANKDPAVYGALILEEVDPAYHQLVGQFLVEETWFDRLKNAEPKIEQHREWFEEMRVYILVELGLMEENIDGEDALEDEVAPINGVDPKE